MALHTSIFKRTFTFKFDARTSRGAMREKISWFIKLWDEKRPDVFGLGECGPLPGLSLDNTSDFEKTIEDTLLKLRTQPLTSDLSKLQIAPPKYSSLQFGLETALLDLVHGGERKIFDNQFVKGGPLPINGLIWMGNADFMIQQVHKKIEEGYTCIKLKIGGLDFEEECKILRYIRKKFSKEQVTLRLDANGAFEESDALEKLTALAEFEIHSIEQPVKQGSSEMARLCQVSPIPIALDEELIGRESEKAELLKSIRPQFIILKPTLHGGMHACHEWITMAESLNIGWWITSALESNVGLNAICQFAANYPISTPQGLGTGMLYENNFPSPLIVQKGHIFYAEERPWDVR
jgi:O-succinylbenzoate synthase